MTRVVRRSLVVLATALALAVPTAAPSRAAIPLPHQDPFYGYDAAALQGVPRGTVLRTRPVTVGIPGSNTGLVPGTQLLYRTQDEQGRPTATVTTVVNPTGPLNAGLVAYLSFYDALGDICSPSYTLRGGDPGSSNSQLADTEAGLVVSLASQGYAVTVPDCEGPGLHWVAGQESGWNTLDGIRATESYLGMTSSQKVGLFGYSGGSIAGEWASELAPSYSPELNIVGTAVGGLPVHLAHNLKYVNGSQSWSGVIPAVLVSLSRAFGIHTKRYTNKYGKQVAAEVQDQCIGSFNGNYPGLKVQDLLKKRYHRFLRIPKITRTVNKLIMGSVPGRPTAPMFMAVGNADGTGDDVMIAQDVEALAHEYCGEGLPVQFTEFSGAKHTEAGIQFFPQAMQFLGERFAGAPFAGNCAQIGPGNSLAPLKVRKRHHHHPPPGQPPPPRPLARKIQTSTTVRAGTHQPEELGAMPAVTVDALTVLPRLREPGLGDQPRPVWQV